MSGGLISAKRLAAALYPQSKHAAQQVYNLARRCGVTGVYPYGRKIGVYYTPADAQTMIERANSHPHAREY